MAELHRHLQYFVARKISTDAGWQQCTVILSGHQVRPTPLRSHMPSSSCFVSRPRLVPSLLFDVVKFISASICRLLAKASTKSWTIYATSSVSLTTIPARVTVSTASTPISYNWLMFTLYSKLYLIYCNNFENTLCNCNFESVLNLFRCKNVP